jgi:uncharacterized OB-fold protein
MNEPSKAATRVAPKPPKPPMPLIDADSIGFWQAAREGRIALCRCTGCDTWLGRPMERCNQCGASTAFVDVSGTGTIYSYIVVHNPSVPAFADLVPYVVALVELAEGPRLPGILLGERGPGVSIGDPVQGELIEIAGTDERPLAFRRAQS